MGSMLLECLDSDADASVVIVLLQWLNPTPMARQRQDYTDHVMLNDCVSARWSPMYQYLALTSLRDSHRMPTRHIREPGNVRRFSSHFSISVSVLRFRTSVSAL